MPEDRLAWEFSKSLTVLLIHQEISSVIRNFRIREFQENPGFLSLSGPHWGQSTDEILIDLAFCAVQSSQSAFKLEGMFVGTFVQFSIWVTQ